MDTAVHFPTSPKAVTARAPTLSRRMNVEAAFAAIMNNCIDQVQANDTGVAKFHDGECLHQMRVGLRRLRSALSIFEDVLSLPEPLQADLDWLVDELGPARDWDVLAGTTLPKVESALSSAAPLAELRLAASNKTTELHAAAAAALASQRYARWMLALQHWVSERGWRAALVPGDKKRLKMGVSAFARTILDKDQARLLKRGRKLAGASAELRHRVRIAAKKTRYAAEFFGSLYPKRKVRPYVKALSHLQDELGWMNDAAVAERLLAALSEDDAALKEGASFVRGYLAGRTQEGKAVLRERWKRFSKRSPP